MLERFIAYFVEKHLLTNMIFVAVIIGGLLSWQGIKKEEMPDVTSDVVRVSAVYPGASAEEVEHFVTRELEELLRGIDGVYRLTSSVNRGSTRINVELEQDYPNKNEAITEIRNVVLEADLPVEIRDKPTVRVFKSSKKAIIDIALINTDAHLLNTEQRKELQMQAMALETRLTTLAQINSVNRRGYLQQELQINVDPAKLVQYRIPLSQVINEVRDNHIRKPAGHIEVKDEPNVTINAQLDTIAKLEPLYVQAGFQGKAIVLSDVAEVREDFRREKEIIKVNGHQAIMFNVVKNSSFGILESLDAVEAVVEEFKQANLKNSNIKLILLDDESIDVRNRLSIISINGAIGFGLILIMLLLFLNKRSGFWVAIGIPFTICFTLISGMLLGYTINNTTLAAVIIVMGIVVDDAIVVAENISRFRSRGFDSYNSAVKGTSQVFMPVVASIITTCIAFVPLFYFSGRFGHLNSFIPPIVFLMLLASLFESLIILPGHIHFRSPKPLAANMVETREHWFSRIEHRYGKILMGLMEYKYIVFGVFVLLLAASGLIASSQMKFVLFPHAETREIVLQGEAEKTADRFETAELTRKIEDEVAPFIGKEVVGVRTGIARSRWGGVAHENKFRMIIEIVSREDRDRSADELISLWKPKMENLPGIKKLIVQKSRSYHTSGSSIEILVQENDDVLRDKAAATLLAAMQKNPDLANADIDTPIKLPEYKIDIKREKVKRLSVSPVDISSTFRAALEGEVLYELPNGNEKIDVRLSIENDAKRNMETILDIPVENKTRYLAPLRELVDIKLVKTPDSISRYDMRRTTRVFADMKTGTEMTPLDIAMQLESGVFRDIVSTQPSTNLSFEGEVFDTRESKNDLRNAVVMVIFLIFAVLAILFNSLSRPLMIILAIPFGVVGVVIAFWLHGQILFGFFAAIGTLGMAGVVINDAIIMLTKLDQEYDETNTGNINERISTVAQTRLKAVVLTTLTTVAGVLPTAYGFAGYDALLSEMMLALAWGLLFGSVITLLLVPCMYSVLQDFHVRFRREAI
ncbi:MAG: efflux RND transporter permease subunit [Gammaproteobacteria bacterium]|nr:efflux RND transporter permease subunit [Gammaproteobacteria bacterium]